MAANDDVGMDAAAGVGVVAAGDGTASTDARRLHFEHEGGSSPEVADVVVQTIRVAALLSSY